MAQLRPIVGLEVHAKVNVLSKLFSFCSSLFGGRPNTNAGFFDIAIPGTMPMLNKDCVRAAVMSGLSLNGEVSNVCCFDRKHYFYSDLPGGYQITQQNYPIVRGGSLEYLCLHNNQIVKRLALLDRIQLEQDSGKSLHDSDSKTSLVDFNRAGCALLEIVTHPVFNDGDDAADFVEELRTVLMRLNTCDGLMEKGSLRVDASVSVQNIDTHGSMVQPLKERTEVKNLNSLKSIRNAVNFEIQRQTKIVQSGGRIFNNTLAYDVVNHCTIEVRDKEKVHDYRFMAEPNLLPLKISSEWLQSIKENLPISRAQIRQSLVEEGLALAPIKDLMSHPSGPNYFFALNNGISDKTKLAQFCSILLSLPVSDVLQEKKARLKECALIFCKNKLPEPTTLSFITAVVSSETPVNQLFEEIDETKLFTTEDALLNLCRTALTKNPKRLAKLRAGKTNEFTKLMTLIRTKNPLFIQKEMLENCLQRVLNE